MLDCAFQFPLTGIGHVCKLLQLSGQIELAQADSQPVKQPADLSRGRRAFFNGLRHTAADIGLQLPVQFPGKIPEYLSDISRGSVCRFSAKLRQRREIVLQLSFHKPDRLGQLPKDSGFPFAGCGGRKAADSASGNNAYGSDPFEGHDDTLSTVYVLSRCSTRNVVNSRAWASG